MRNVSPRWKSGKRSGAGFSLLELMVAITITALLSTAVIASFRIGISSWRRGEDFLDRSQRLSAASSWMEKQIGSTNAFYPVSVLNTPTNLNKPMATDFSGGAAFVGEKQELIFVSDNLMAGSLTGGLQVVRYFVTTPDGTKGGSEAPGAAPLGSLQVTSSSIFRRSDLPALLDRLRSPEVQATTLLENIREINFQYWGEEQPAPGTPVQPGLPHLVAYDEWNGMKLHKLPEAVSIQVHFAGASDGAPGKAYYNRDSLKLYIPINVSKTS